MAELTAPVVRPTGIGLTQQQFGAIAWLRWRIFANGFRRKGGTGELIGRLVLIPLFAALALIPVLGAGLVSFALSRRDALEHITWVFWAAFLLTQLLNINLGQPGTTFDPTELIRFPMPLRNYVLVRLCFGVLSPANVIVTLMSLAIFVGITIHRPALWPYTLVAAAIFALTNVLFSRMVFAWVDRWLSTRRAREIFTAIVFGGSLLIQYLNVAYNPGFRHTRHHTPQTQNLHHAETVLHRIHPYIGWLPPELTGAAIASAADAEPGPWLLDLLACSIFAIAFLSVYSVRMRTEYQGENLSDQANAVAALPERRSDVVTPAVLTYTPVVAPDAGSRFVPATLVPLLAKEVLTMRRNTGLLYGVVAPTVMVFLFAGRLSLRGSAHWVVLAAVAYALLGIAPMSYNSFGMEGPGAQFYFMAPIPLREVFFAKNVMAFLLAIFEALVVTFIVAYVSGAPRLSDSLFALLWAVGTLLLNTTIGNFRSISAPRKVDPGRSMNRAQSQVSAWMSIGILLASAVLALGFQALGMLFHQPWIQLTYGLVFAATGVLVYTRGLRSIEAFTLARRDTLFEELGRKT